MTPEQIARARRVRAAGVIRGGQAPAPPPTAREIAEEGVFRGFCIGFTVGVIVVGLLWVVEIAARVP